MDKIQSNLISNILISKILILVIYYLLTYCPNVIPRNNPQIQSMFSSFVILLHIFAIEYKFLNFSSHLEFIICKQFFIFSSVSEFFCEVFRKKHARNKTINNYYHTILVIIFTFTQCQATRRLGAELISVKSFDSTWLAAFCRDSQDIADLNWTNNKKNCTIALVSKFIYKSSLFSCQFSKI